jgi:hypothetical protein
MRRLSDTLLIPAGYFHKTETNIAANDKVLVTLGSSKVRGPNGAGTGFLVRGTATFVTSGPDFETMKSRFGWARASLAIAIDCATQTRQVPDNIDRPDEPSVQSIAGACRN